MDETLAAAQLERVQALAETMVGAASQTIRPARGTGQGTSSGRSDAALELLRGLGPGQVRVELGETLGQGGMGLVRSGRQLSMGREVAVKTTREDRRSDRATLELLREAWVTGALEHPNILPVYTVGLDDEGAPVIVMRRVDGEDWQALMDAPARVAERFGEHDLLEWNLRVLMQVCSALSCAHERGLIHRDLKPANVMLGRFGEVYLVDWGIAVGVADDEEGRFPRPEAEGVVVGTPAYMAPEMLAGRSSQLGPHTDVYLAGAVLYELLAGEAPHRQGQLEAFVHSVMHSPPALPEDCTAPPELAQICRRAMAAEPEQRYASAEQLRLALAAFLRHRSSSGLARGGHERLAQLRAALGRRDETSEEPALGEDELQELFSEARFAFELAQREWADNVEARAGLRELLECMAGEHLRRGELGAATRLLGELERAPPALLAGVEQLRAELDAQERERERLARVSRDHDARFGQRTRWFGLILLGSIWSLSPLAAARWMPVPESFVELAVVPVALLLLFGGFTYWGRESMLGTSYNRKIVGLIVGTLACQLVLYLGHVLAGEPVVASLAPQFFLWSMATAFTSITMGVNAWPASLAYLAAFFYLSSVEARGLPAQDYGELVLHVMALSHAVLTATCLILWRPRSWFRRLPDEHEHGSG